MTNSANGEVPLPIKFFLKTYTKNLTNPYQQAYRLIFEYIEAFYNTKRIHSHCDYMSPNDFEKLYEQTQTNGQLLVS